MDNYNLKSVFDEMKSNNIYINLDSDYLQSILDKPKYDKKMYIGYIEGSNNIPTYIMENLYEEGSVVLVYNFVSNSKTFSKSTLQILLHAIFNNFGFEPHIIFDEKKIRIELVVTLEVFTCNFKIAYEKYINEVEEISNILDPTISNEEDESVNIVEIDIKNEEESKTSPKKN